MGGGKEKKGRGSLRDEPRLVGVLHLLPATPLLCRSVWGPLAEPPCKRTDCDRCGKAAEALLGRPLAGPHAGVGFSAFRAVSVHQAVLEMGLSHPRFVFVQLRSRQRSRSTRWAHRAGSVRRNRALGSLLATAAVLQLRARPWGLPSPCCGASFQDVSCPLCLSPDLGRRSRLQRACEAQRASRALLRRKYASTQVNLFSLPAGIIAIVCFPGS